MINVLNKYKFTEYSQGNEDFVSGSHKEGNYKYAPELPAVYVIKHMETGMFYVGQTSAVGRRISHHFGHLRRGVHTCYRLQEIFDKYSEGDFWFCYTHIDNSDERHSLEEHILSENSNNDLLLNTMIDGVWNDERNPELAESQRKKLSEFAKTRVGDKNPFYGKAHTSETRERLRRAHLGKENTACWKAVVVNGVYYKNLESASEALGIPQATVSHRVNNKDYIYCNYYEPKDEDDVRVVDERLLFDPKMKAVRSVFEIEGVLYYSTDDILKVHTDVKKSAIHYRIKSKNSKFKNWKKII